MNILKISCRYLLYFVVIIAFLGCKDRQNIMIKDPNELLSVIANRNISYKKLVKTVEKLSEVTEASTFWSDIANSQKYSKKHRRIAIVELFLRHIKPGMTLSQLARILDNPNWLQSNNVNLVTDVFGWLPLKKLSPGTVFHIWLFPETPGLIWSISLRISGEITKDDFLKAIWGQEVDPQVLNAQILEIGMCTPDYKDNIWNAGIDD